MPAPPFPGPDPKRAAARRALALLALLAFVAAADPAHALAAEPRVKVMHEAGPFQVAVDADPSSGQASASACVEHDPMWRIRAGQDGDGDVAVWVPAGSQQADGSHKAKPTCGQDTPGPCVESGLLGERDDGASDGTCKAPDGPWRRQMEAIDLSKGWTGPVFVGPELPSGVDRLFP